MANEIIPYVEMCRREGVSLQRGMNFGLGGNHSVILMSIRPNAPYQDELQDEGSVLIYEGHDEPKSSSVPNPKRIDQPGRTSSGSLPRMAFSIRLLRNSARNLVPPKECVFMKNSVRVFGHTMVCSTLSTHGFSRVADARSLNLNLWPWKARMT